MEPTKEQIHNCLSQYEMVSMEFSDYDLIVKYTNNLGEPLLILSGTDYKFFNDFSWHPIPSDFLTDIKFMMGIGREIIKGISRERSVDWAANGNEYIINHNGKHICVLGMFEEEITVVTNTSCNYFKRYKKCTEFIIDLIIKNDIHYYKDKYIEAQKKLDKIKSIFEMPIPRPLTS